MRALIVFIVAAMTGACAHEMRTPAAQPDSAPEETEYRIGAADVLRIAVWKNEELSRTVPVRPDGTISMPLLNDVHAAGLTPMELRDLVSRELEEYMPRPQVSVIVQEVHSRAVSVLGEVTHAGRYELKGRSTVLDAIAFAGGITPFARRARVLILRQEANGVKRIPFDYDKAISPEGAQGNLYVQSGDIIVVP
jgi:polysaccharide export outer membrane protein